MTKPNDEYVGWLVEHSMLNNAKKLALRYGGQGRMWQQPFAEARPRAASALASVWFTAYPAAIVTRPGESVLRTLADPASLDGVVSHRDPGGPQWAYEALGRHPRSGLHAHNRRKL